MRTIQADEVIYSKRKTIAVTVFPDGKVVVRAPLHASQVVVERFLRDKAGWIRSAQEQMRNAPPRAPAQRFEDGELLWYLGEQYPLELREKVPGGLAFVKGKGFLLERAQKPRAEALLRAFYKRELRARVEELVRIYSARGAFRPGALRISSARTRWGSCSQANVLSFSFRLALTPPACVEYVVVHELAHTREHNHSARFWQLVAQTLPEYKQPRDWLKKNGALLPPIG
jgi:predicted metal-dependent hydrolase